MITNFWLSAAVSTILILFSQFSAADQMQITLGKVGYENYALPTEFNGDECEVVSGLGLPRVEQQRLAHTLEGRVLNVKQVVRIQNGVMYKIDDDALVDHIKCIK
jgi:hypothetical protein